MSTENKQLKELATDSYKRIATHQLPNGLIPASVGRHDDEHFNGKVWVKDHVRATRFALDPLVQQTLPELSEPARHLYLSATRGILLIQAQPEQLFRFQSRPGDKDENGYSTIDDRFVPAIKFNSDGTIYYDWGHNQPDNWGILLSETGKGIAAGWPVLAKDKDGFAPGEVLQSIISYLTNLKLERFRCRSLWEQNPVRSSYSTRRIGLAGLEHSLIIWPELISDSQVNDYPLLVSEGQLQDAAGSLKEKVTEHFPADNTDTEHESVSDLASLVVLNDRDLAEDEQLEIIQRAIELENSHGFYRYHGDPWKRGRAEAKWTMGKPIVARYYFRQAKSLYEAGKSREAFRSLDRGLWKINDILTIKREVGFIPELYSDVDGDYKANNNELAWTHDYIIEASAAGIVALMAEQDYEKHAAVA